MRDVLVATAASVGFLFVGCASMPPVPPEPARPYITLEKEPEGEAWRPTWHLERPASALRFERKGAGFRSELFEVLTPGFTMHRDGDAEILRTSGEPADTVAVRFPEFTRTLEKEYLFFQKFSDGSVAIYTGHLVARAVLEDDDADRTWDALHERCGSGAPVALGFRLGGSDKSVEVSCMKSRAPRPAWVKVEGRPR